MWGDVGLERTTAKSQQLESSLRDSRQKRESDQKEFLSDLKSKQEGCLEKEKLMWSRYSQEREENRLNHIKDQAYLDGLLKTNSTKAESRLVSVRRWH
jgi:hypothetical protein